MNKRRFAAILLFLAMILSTFSSCKDTNEPQMQAKTYYEFFDTQSLIFSYSGDSSESFKANCEAVADLLEKYHRLFDIYYEYSGINNLKTVNKNAGVKPTEVDKELIDFLVYAKEIYTITNGKTNIALGSVLKLWHDERENADYEPESAKLPSKEKLQAASLHTDINAIVIDEENCTVYISDPDVQLDVGALGKGYATEKAAQLHFSRGVSSDVLNIGGNIRAIGTKLSGEGWITGITNPDKSSDESFVCRVILKDSSLVTSGNYERFYTVDGVAYHHIIDPTTNMPATYFSSVSVFCEDSGLADALSTALFCVSYEDGLNMIKSIGDIEVIWVGVDGTVKMTDGVDVFS